MALKTNYKEDVFSGNRKYRMTDNGDGSVSFEDVTTYSQVGDSFGAADINATNSAINTTNSIVETLDTWTIISRLSAMGGNSDTTTISLTLPQLKSSYKKVALALSSSDVPSASGKGSFAVYNTTIIPTAFLVGFVYHQDPSDYGNEFDSVCVYGLNAVGSLHSEMDDTTLTLEIDNNGSDWAYVTLFGIN